ncbi:MAG: hypothetical protein R8M38_08480 [Mariprofundaceae bacterium]
MKTDKLLLCILLILIFVQSAHAWETDINSRYSGWLAIYNSTGQSFKNQIQHKDEHVVMSDEALQKLGVGQYAFNRPPFTITDLNASYFRVDELRKMGSYPSAPTPWKLETRLLPPASQFSGIPDYSFSMIDWINKNKYCTLTGGGDKWCHKYQGWLGALNSNHFGTQATNYYQRLHKLAIHLAIRAKEMREKISKAPGAAKEYRVFIQEAEREALSVEGYAQHFLQDRWSMGHMWERWGSSDYNILPNKNIVTNLEISSAAGLIHGSEAVTGNADAMSSPYVPLVSEYSKPVRVIASAANKAYKWLKSFVVKPDNTPDLYAKVDYIIPTWVHQSDHKLHKGAGDDRYQDILDKKFGKEYTLTIGKDYPLNVTLQKTEMMQCFMAGWSEVIRGFGQNEKGGFGIDGATPNGSIKGFSSLKHGCFDMWATNRSIALGWFDSVTSAATLGRIILVTKASWSSTKSWGEFFKKGYKAYMADRLGWMKVHYRVWKEFKNDKTGTSLARGKIGSLLQTSTGDNYPNPAPFVEPKNINTLPDDSPQTGMDKKAWFGFFNRSHSDYWCENSQDAVFHNARLSSEPLSKATCGYLADRFYEGTDPNYKGENSEIRTTDGRPGGKKVSSICSLLKNKPSTYDESTPYFLHPGYVEKPFAKDKDGNLKSITNWCNKIPVINYIPDDSGEIRDDWVAKLEDWDKELTITGFNFGEEAGTLTSECGLPDIEKLEIAQWSEDSISFMPPKKVKEFAKDGEAYTLCITRKDGVKSVGSFNFVFKVKPVKIEQIQVKDDKGVYFDKQAGISKVIPYGEMQYEITFAEKMDTMSSNTEMRIGGKLIIGGWKFSQDRTRSEAVWLGKYNSPEVVNDENRFDTGLGNHFEGEQVLHINARSVNGAGVDPGPDPIPFKPKGDATDEIFKAGYKSPNQEHSLTFGGKEEEEKEEEEKEGEEKEGEDQSGTTIISCLSSKYTTASGWYETGVKIKSGQKYTIKATGKWSLGTDDRTSDADGLSTFPNHLGYRQGTLMGSLNGTLFQIGKEHTFVAKESGELKLACNDSSSHDNNGCLKVTITEVSKESNSCKDILGKWNLGKFVLNISQAGDGIKAVMEVAPPNPIGFKKGDELFSGKIADKKVNGTMEVRSKLKKGKEQKKHRARMELKLSEDGNTLKGHHENYRYSKGEWIKREGIQSVTFTRVEKCSKESTEEKVTPPKPEKPTSPPKEAPKILEEWKVYRLDVIERENRLPDIMVEETSFERTSESAQLKVTGYHVDTAKNEETGKASWKINWSHQEVLQAKSAGKTGVEGLTKAAHKLRQGLVGKAEISSLIQKHMGDLAVPLTN